MVNWLNNQGEWLIELIKKILGIPSTSALSNANCFYYYDYLRVMRAYRRYQYLYARYCMRARKRL